MPQSRTERQIRRFRGRRKRPRVLMFSNWQEELLMDVIISEAGRFEWETMDSRFLRGDASEWRPDGVLCCQWADGKRVAQLRQLGCPGVLVGAQDGSPGKRGMPQVIPDRALTGALAAEYFLERGFQHICLVLQEHPGAMEMAGPLYESFKRVAEQGGADCPDVVVLPSLGPDPTVFGQAVAAWLATVPRPLGVLAYGDIFAGHFVAHCQEAGASVPEEVAVMGLGNKRKFCKLSPVPLSSIDPDPARHGREAVHLLQRLMRGEAAPAEVIRVPPAGVVTRRSTNILAVADTAVAHGLRFLWEHLGEPISVDDAAAAADVSRATLERRFRKQLGRTVNQELLRKRLERCCELLTSTDLTVTDIAPRIGFHSKHYLHRAFRSKYGMSPREFRVHRA